MSTTTTTLPPPVQQEFSEKMLSTPMPRLVHSLFAIPRTIDGNMGRTLRMRRYNRLQTVPVPVDPLFMNPPAQQLTAIKISVVYKPLVIDLEACSESHGDKAQAKAA